MNFPEQLKAVFVDFDGTLVDSTLALRNCFETFLGNYNIKASDDEFQSLVGPSLFEIVEKLRVKYSLPSTQDSLYEEYSELIRNCYAEKVFIFVNALEVLRKTKNRGIKLAIVTSARLSLIEIFLSRYGLQTFFDALITSLKHEPSKPFPDLYLRAMKTLGVSNNEAIAIEDSVNGIASAHSAGLYVIQFGSSPIAKGAQLTVKNWDEAGDALQGYQTHIVEPTFQVEVVDSQGKIELSDVQNQYVDELWNAAQKRHEGKLFNGKLLNYLKFEKGRLFGSFVEYKYYMAQRDDFKLKQCFRIRPIAISCLCTFQGRVLVGKRSALVTDYPGFYELVPSGGIDPAVVENGKVNLVRQTFIELLEETGIESKQVGTCYPLALFEDFISDSVEICMRIELNNDQLSPLENGEYSQLKWMPFSQLQQYALSEKENFVQLSLHLIGKYLNKF